MCTSIIEVARAEGMAKRGDEWFPLSQAVVSYDHARHAPLGDVRWYRTGSTRTAPTSSEQPSVTSSTVIPTL